MPGRDLPARILRAAPLAFLAALPVAVAADALVGPPGPVGPSVLVAAAGALLVAAVFVLPRTAAVGGAVAIAALPLLVLGTEEAALVRLVTALACLAVAWEVTRQRAPQA